MVRRCWVNFQCWGVLLIWIIVEQGPIVLAVVAGGSCLDIFSLIYHFSFLSPSLWETARYRLKYCLKGPLSPNNQPTNQIDLSQKAEKRCRKFLSTNFYMHFIQNNMVRTHVHIHIYTVFPVLFAPPQKSG